MFDISASFDLLHLERYPDNKEDFTSISNSHTCPRQALVCAYFSVLSSLYLFIILQKEMWLFFGIEDNVYNFWKDKVMLQYFL